jgi:surface carbohydrate biosynthesis protein
VVLSADSTAIRGSGAREQRRIGLVVDHPLRDLHGTALVAHHLARMGHLVSLVPFYAQHLDLPQLDLDLLVLNYVRPANAAVVARAERLGTALAVLDTEGGLLADSGPTSPAGIAAYLRESGVDKRLAVYLFWGSALRDAVVAGTRLPPERALVTGCPRFDLAHAPWRERPADRANAPVLVNTNFPVVNSAHAVDGSIDRTALQAVGLSEDTIANLVATNRRVMEAFVEAVASLASARPERRFVLRPHPFESDAPYRRRFAEHPNVEIRRQGSVLDELARCSALLHVNCTTAIEAVLCGVPPISLDYANHPLMLDYAALPTQVSHRAHDPTAALALIDGAADAADSDTRPRRMAAIEPYFGPLDGHAAERAAAALAAAANALPPRALAHGGGEGLATRTAAALGSITVEAARQLIRPARRGKALDISAVRAALSRFAEAEGTAAATVRRHRSRSGLPLLSLSVERRSRAGAR